ncbi:MAG: type III PLP-dependent enzyme [Actinobacteria bacterium]|nr:alanine racemase [Actinomycetota bacterium]PLS86338.1 MAG: type III PLP-dependent enzyme [Actinomycetota bacterium]
MRTQIDKAHDLGERLGGWRDGVLAPGGVKVSEIAAEHGSPFYLYHGEMIVDRVRRVREALGGDVEVTYSVKANPNLAVTQVIAREHLTGAEVASSGELVVARTAGFEPEDIVFAGPAKTDEELDMAVREGIFAVNVESVNEINRLAAVAERRNKNIGVGLRINPAQQLMGSGMRMGGTVGQFGLDEADLEEAVRRTLAHPDHLTLRGIHVYTATQVFEVDPLIEHCRNIFELALRTADLAGKPLEMIDFGGGFGVPYFEKLEDFDLERFGAGFQELLAHYRTEARLEGCRFVFELGRYLVADAGLYVTKVIDVKDMKGKTFVTTDGGMNHHLTATGNMGQVFRKAYPILNLSRAPGEGDEPVALAGPCCTPLDMFGTNIPLADPEPGDLVGVFYSGAYGFSASNLGFLSHPNPAEILIWQGEARLLRPVGKPEDVLKGQEALV